MLTQTLHMACQFGKIDDFARFFKQLDKLTRREPNNELLTRSTGQTPICSKNEQLQNRAAIAPLQQMFQT